MFIYLLFLLISNVVSFDMPETWINPADILHSTKLEEINSDVPRTKPSMDTESSSTCENFTCPAPLPSVCDSYLKRMVNLLLNEVNLKNYKLPKGDIRIIPLTLHFTSGNLEILHKLASTETEEDIPWHEFDIAFSSLFVMPNDFKESKSENTLISPSYYEYVYFIFFGIVGSLVIIGFWLLLTGGSILRTIWSLSLLNFAFALVWNLIRAYNMEKEKVREIYHNRFKEKQPSSSWFGIFDPFLRLMSRKSDSDGEIPFIPETDPLVNVNYGKVFMETLGTIFELLPIMGEKTGEMYAKFADSQNFFVRNVIMPVNLLLNPLLIIVAFVCWAIIREGFSFRLPLASFSIGNRASCVQPSQNQRSHAEIENNQPSNTSRQQIQNQPEQGIVQNVVSRIHNSAQIAYESIPGPSHSSPKIKRIITEYHHDSEESSNPSEVMNTLDQKRNKPARLPSITVTRKVFRITTSFSCKSEP
ncbi:hypothetical protein O3M35_001490 [Rhynocoris fuscipes]|uniref:Chloride channel CLIC-like protein 1 n=1 Tax=Rhynocoris fuscipes TaxID=488301 RepID=A0AAW1CQ81_9HEMI